MGDPTRRTPLAHSILGQSYPRRTPGRPFPAAVVASVALATCIRGDATATALLVSDEQREVVYVATADNRYIYDVRTEEQCGYPKSQNHFAGDAGTEVGIEIKFR